MNILLAPNSMKGSMNAFDFAAAIERGLMRASDQFKLLKCPVADGGDFTAPILARALNATEVKVPVHDPLGRPLVTHYFLTSSRVAIIELADASGLRLLLPEEQNPLHTSTYGLGELILAAVAGGASQILIGVGGSATVDGGTGMLQALGVQFYDRNNHSIDRGGVDLLHIDHLEEGSLLQAVRNVPITVICDVSNPLTGPNGAAAVFGPQKGADPSMVFTLEQGLTHWGRMVDDFYNEEIHEQLYTGAAGGVGMALKAFAGAILVPGADFILDTLHFNRKLEWADLVITGEGLLDRQTSCLKAPFVVATRARKYDKKVIAFAGGLKEVDYSVFDAAWSITSSPMTLEFSVKNAISLTENLSYNIGKLINELL